MHISLHLNVFLIDIYVWYNLTVDSHDWATRGYWKRISSIQQGLLYQEIYYVPFWTYNLNAMIDPKMWVYHLYHI
jgi:hypothetical protein